MAVRKARKQDGGEAEVSPLLLQLSKAVSHGRLDLDALESLEAWFKSDPDVAEMSQEEFDRFFEGLVDEGFVTGEELWDDDRGMCAANVTMEDVVAEANSRIRRLTKKLKKAKRQRK